MILTPALKEGTVIDQMRIRKRLPPALRTSTVLIAAALTSTALGVVSWSIATRVLSARDLGLGSANVSLAVLIAGGCHLGLNYGIVRFADREAPRTHDLINAGGTWVLCAAAVASIGIVAFSALVPSGSGSDVLWMTLAVSSWALFTFGDPIQLLVGDEAGVVVRNAIVATARLALLPVLAAPLGHLAFVGALALAGLLGLALTVGHFLPAACRGYRPRLLWRIHGAGRIWRYSLASYVAAFVGGAAALAMPILVNILAGPEATAYFSVAWIIAGTMALAPTALSSAIFLHSSRDSAVPWTQLYLGVALVGGLSVAAVLTSGIWRPMAYHVLGPQYLRGAEDVGNVLLLSTLPLAINAGCTAVLRYAKATWRLTVSATVTTIAVVVLTWTWIPIHGILGAALGWLVGQAVGSILFISLARQVHVAR